MSLAWPVLALGDQALDLALDLAGLAGLLVVVGLLERLGRLRLDGGLHRGDERLLVERARPAGRPSCRPWRPWPARPRSSVGASAASWASLAFDAAGGCAFLPLAKPLTRAGDLGERRVLVGPDAGRGDRRLQQLVGGQRRRSRRRARRRPPPAAGAGAAPAGAAPLPGRRLRRLRRGLAQRADRRHRLGRRHRLLRPAPTRARSRSSSPRAPTPAACGPSRSTGTPAALAAFSPFSTVSMAGSSRRTSRRAASMSLTASAPGDRSRAAISALTAAFPALRCSASSPGGRADPGATRHAALRRPYGEPRWPARSGSGVRPLSATAHDPSCWRQHPPTQYRLARGLSGRLACPKGRHPPQDRSGGDVVVVACALTSRSDRSPSASVHR